MATEDQIAYKVQSVVHRGLAHVNGGAVHPSYIKGCYIVLSTSSRIFCLDGQMWQIGRAVSTIDHRQVVRSDQD